MADSKYDDESDDGFLAPHKCYGSSSGKSKQTASATDSKFENLKQINDLNKANLMQQCTGQIFSHYKGDYDNGKERRSVGTGTLYKHLDNGINGYVLIITCAHNLIKLNAKDKPEVVDKLWYLPNGKDAQNEEKSIRIKCVDWTQHNKYNPNEEKNEYDIGMILCYDEKEHYQKLDVNDTVILKQRDKALRSCSIYGYPAQRGGELWGGEGSADKDKFNNWKYDNINTYPGQSGSAIYRINDDDKFEILGIHIYGDIREQINRGVKLTKDKIKWITETEEEMKKRAIQHMKEMEEKKKPDEIRDFLASINLKDKYYDVFKRNGYHTMNDLKLKGTLDLMSMGITKVFDRKKIEKGIKKYFDKLIIQKYGDNMDKLIETQVECNDDQQRTIIESCSALKRMVICLIFYYKKDIDEKQDRADFIDVMSNIYKMALNDYIHIIKVHKHHLQDINKALLSIHPRCDIINCRMAARHYREMTARQERIFKKLKDDTDESYSIIALFASLMDITHFTLLHIFDVGLRVNSEPEIDSGDTSFGYWHKHKDDWRLFDKSFATMASALYHKEKKAGIFLRVAKFTGSKFGLPDGVEVRDETTFMTEELFANLLKNDVSSQSIRQLYHFLIDQHYDSDAVRFDFEDESEDIKTSNITNRLHSDSGAIRIVNLVVTDKYAQEMSFDCGVLFFYWEYYKEIYLSYMNGITAPNGYSIADLYVKKRYSSPKEEVLYKDFINPKYFNYLLMFKAEQYMTTQSVKATQAHRIAEELHYDIKEGDPISLNHLLAVFMYTDFTQLSFEFSATLRKSVRYETTESIKKRNSHFWWMSKLLRETVQSFGYGSDAKRFNYIGANETLKGPYYCGMHNMVNVDDTELRFNCPLSTSRVIQVATQFSGFDGVIMQFNYGYPYLNALDTSWLSNYPEEEEVVFFGGLFTVGIEAIILKKTCQNFGKFFGVMHCFNCMINGKKLENVQITKGDKEKMLALIQSELGNKDIDKPLPPYICTVFRVLLLKQTSLIINLNYLDKYFGDISDLIIDSNSHLPVDYMFELFDKVTKITINSSDDFGKTSYPFSLKSLLKLIISKQLTIEIVSVQSRGNSWIKKHWKKAKSSLQKKYKKYDYDIHLYLGEIRNTGDLKGVTQDSLRIHPL